MTDFVEQTEEFPIVAVLCSFGCQMCAAVTRAAGIAFSSPIIYCVLKQQ